MSFYQYEGYHVGKEDRRDMKLFMNYLVNYDVLTVVCPSVVDLGLQIFIMRQTDHLRGKVLVLQHYVSIVGKG